MELILDINPISRGDIGWYWISYHVVLISIITGWHLAVILQNAVGDPPGTSSWWCWISIVDIQYHWAMLTITTRGFDIQYHRVIYSSGIITERRWGIPQDHPDDIGWYWISHHVVLMSNIKGWYLAVILQNVGGDPPRPSSWYRISTCDIQYHSATAWYGQSHHLVWISNIKWMVLGDPPVRSETSLQGTTLWQWISKPRDMISSITPWYWILTVDIQYQLDGLGGSPTTFCDITARYHPVATVDMKTTWYDPISPRDIGYQPKISNINWMVWVDPLQRSVMSLKHARLTLNISNLLTMYYRVRVDYIYRQTGTWYLFRLLYT